MDDESKKIFQIGRDSGKITVGPDGSTLLDRDGGTLKVPVNGKVTDLDGAGKSWLLFCVIEI